jgi:hypothetical protein
MELTTTEVPVVVPGDWLEPSCITFLGGKRMQRKANLFNGCTSPQVTIRFPGRNGCNIHSSA